MPVEIQTPLYLPWLIEKFEGPQDAMKWVPVCAIRSPLDGTKMMETWAFPDDKRFWAGEGARISFHEVIGPGGSFRMREVTGAIAIVEVKKGFGGKY